MQPCDDNKVTTILLLFALGFLIYYLSCSNNSYGRNNNMNGGYGGNMNSGSRNRNYNRNQENFESNFFKDNVPSNVVNYAKDEPKMFNDNKQKEYPADFNMGYELPENQLQNAQPLQPVPQNPVHVVVPQKQEMQTAKTILKPEQVKEVHDYSAWDGTGSSIADLDEGFKPLVDGNVFSPDQVKLATNVEKFDNKDFLPKEVIPGAFDDFAVSKYTIDDDKLINTERYIIGINTVGQSLKNGSHDIRGTIANPKFSVSPWNNSTYEPDYNIKPLC